MAPDERVFETAYERTIEFECAEIAGSIESSVEKAAREHFLAEEKHSEVNRLRTLVDGDANIGRYRVRLSWLSSKPSKA